MRQILSFLPEKEFTVCMAWDLVAQCSRKSAAYWVAFEFDGSFAARQSAIQQLGGQQHLVLSYYGMLWCSVTSVRDPCYMSETLQAAVSSVVLRAMANPVPLEPPEISESCLHM